LLEQKEKGYALHVFFDNRLQCIRIAGSSFVQLNQKFRHKIYFF